MKSALALISTVFQIWNDTATKTDFSKFTHNQLKDHCSTLNTKAEAIENTYEEDVTWKPEDVSNYAELVTEIEEVRNLMDKSPETLRQRRQVTNLGENASALTNTLSVLNRSIQVHEPNVLADPNRGFKTANEFLLEVVNASSKPNYEPSENFRAHVCNAVGSDEYSLGSWASGGALVPEGFINDIIKTPHDESPLLSGMTSLPMGGPTVKINARVDKNHSTSFTGGTVVKRTSETLQGDSSKDQFEKISMEASELVGNTYVTDMLLRYSSISIPAMISDSFKIAGDYKLRSEFMTGDGNGKYLGVFSDSNPCAIDIGRNPLQADTYLISGLDILRMRQRCWNYSSAVWVFNLDLFVWVAQLSVPDPSGVGVIKLYAPETGDTPATILGRPVVFEEFCPGATSGTGADVTEFGTYMAALVNPTQWYHGELYRDTAQSVHVRFLEREQVFQWVMADDARPSWLTVITPAAGVTTTSPCIRLLSASVAV